VQRVGLKVCSGGILGMGESRRDRAGLLCQLANLPQPPESVPINLLVQVEGTPLYGTAALDPFELVRTVAAARILMPNAHVRLSAGRSEMSDEIQALCYLAGANSIFYGDRLLTTPNAESDRDLALFERLGLSSEAADHPREVPGPCLKLGSDPFLRSSPLQVGRPGAGPEPTISPAGDA
jgi:biotin synthase